VKTRSSWNKKYKIRNFLSNSKKSYKGNVYAFKVDSQMFSGKFIGGYFRYLVYSVGSHLEWGAIFY